MMNILKRFFKKEFWGLFKYGIVGGASLLLHIGLYALLSRVIWVSGSRTVQYIGTLIFVACLNFTMHRLWTFEVKTKSFSMVIRYAIIVLTSMGLQGVIFYIINDVLHLYDAFAFAGAAGIAIIYQYFGHRFVTYNVRFEKKVVNEPEPPVV